MVCLYVWGHRLQGGEQLPPSLPYDAPLLFISNVNEATGILDL